MDSQAPQPKKNDEEMRNIIEEARVILPGLQAVFGFQTAAVFNDRFTDLETYAKVCHLIGLGLIVVSMAMLMTPAVYYRAQRGNATQRMVNVSRKSIRGALIPMSLGFSLDMLTVMSLATGGLAISIAAGALTLALFAGLWYVMPTRDPAPVTDQRRDESHVM
jgi:hypothetical protein